MTRWLAVLAFVVAGCSSPTRPTDPPIPTSRVVNQLALECEPVGSATLARISGFGRQDGEWPGALANGDFYEVSTVSPVFTTHAPAAYWWADGKTYGEAHAYTSRFRVALKAGADSLIVEGALACSGFGLAEDAYWWFFDVRGCSVNGVAIPFDTAFDRVLEVGRWTVRVNERLANGGRAMRITGNGRREVVLGETTWGCL